MAPSVVCLINAICAADRRLNLILGAPLVADFGRLAWESPLVAALGGVAWECPSVANLVRLALDRSLVADSGQLVWERPLVTDLGRLAQESPWWPIWADRHRSALRWLIWLN